MITTILAVASAPFLIFGSIAAVDWYLARKYGRGAP